MRALAILLLLMGAAEAKSLQCALWPHQPACRPLPVPVPPFKPAAPAGESKSVPPAVTVAPAAKRTGESRKRIKSNFKKAKPKEPGARQFAEWCARVPSWAPQSLVESNAVARLNRPLTVLEKQQIAACLASKRQPGEKR